MYFIEEKTFFSTMFLLIVIIHKIDKVIVQNKGKILRLLMFLIK